MTISAGFCSLSVNYPYRAVFRVTAVSDSRWNFPATNIQPNLRTKYGERDIDLYTPLTAMLRDFIGRRTSELLFCTSTGSSSSSRTLSKTAFIPS